MRKSWKVAARHPVPLCTYYLLLQSMNFLVGVKEAHDTKTDQPSVVAHEPFGNVLKGLVTGVTGIPTLKSDLKYDLLQILKLSAQCPLKISVLIFCFNISGSVIKYCNGFSRSL